MQTLKNIAEILPPSTGSRVLLNANQTTADIIRALVLNHKINVIQGKKIARYFEGDTDRETARNIWEFLKYNIPYKVEPGERQTIKSLSRIISDARGGFGSDCKHFATFTGVILHALKIPLSLIHISEPTRPY